MLIKENFRDSITIPTRTKSSFEPIAGLGPQHSLGSADYNYMSGNAAGSKNTNFLKGHQRSNDGVKYGKITNSSMTIHQDRQPTNYTSQFKITRGATDASPARGGKSNYMLNLLNRNAVALSNS